MVRVREFDPEKALVDAMHVFQRHGYVATSMEDIVSETGVSRYGLYGAFGSKKDLLVEALHLYENNMKKLLWTDLRKPDAGRTEIIEHWQSIRKFAEDEEFNKGCLIINVAVEVAPHEPEIALEVQRIDNDQASVLAAAIRNGQKAGDIPPDVDADGAARMFVVLSRGLALMVRAGAKLTDWESAVETGLKIFDFPKTRG